MILLSYIMGNLGECKNIVVFKKIMNIIKFSKIIILVGNFFLKFKKFIVPFS